jgi:hypothetical protein
MNPFAKAAAAAGEGEAVKVVTPDIIPGRTCHIDGDYLAYYASGNEDTPAGRARENSLAIIKRATSLTGSERAVVHLTAPGSTKADRYIIATVKPYQGNRVGNSKPKNWAYLRDFLTQYDGKSFVKKVWASREADDGMAACAQFAARNGRLDAIYSADKDMRMFPGVHMDWLQHDSITIVHDGCFSVYGKNGKLYGHEWFWHQMLHGDSADHIPGLEFTCLPTVKGNEERLTKVGPAVAAKVLQGVETDGEAFERVWASYERGYRFKSTEFAADRFVEQAALLWMRRDNAASTTDYSTYMPNNQFTNEAWERLVARVAATKESYTCVD